MTITVQPSTLKGYIQAPASKSCMQRACAAALLHKGSTTIYNAGISNDDKAALQIIAQLGASVSQVDHSITIFSPGFTNQFAQQNIVINCGESGLSIRMFAPIVAIAAQAITLTGQGSLLSRPMHFFDTILPLLGVSIVSNKGMLPLQIKGPLCPTDISIDGSLSSQFLTGLLFALGATATNQITIQVNNLKSKPYISLTLAIMSHFGYSVTNHNFESFVISAKIPTPEHIEYTVEGDWSSASFLLVAAAISGSISIGGLHIQSTQADKAILQVLQQCQANIVITDNLITMSASTLQPFVFDATECPDLFPPLVALAAYCKGTSIIYGTHRLAAKESDRALSLQQVFGQMGIQIELCDNDAMQIKGGAVNAAKVSSHHDHRIAMAAAVAAVGAKGIITITHAEAINKSYPQFYQHLISLGVKIDEVE